MDVKSAVPVLAALAQETRLRALGMLVEHGEEGLPAGHLAEALGVPHNTLSAHLKALRAAGLVDSERQSRSIIYKAVPTTMRELARFLEAVVGEVRTGKS
jgi:ArsR family transcriptional regulator, arsenate/arsenite/antimonite-responsive transcriptional repressor